VISFSTNGQQPDCERTHACYCHNCDIYAAAATAKIVCCSLSGPRQEVSILAGSRYSLAFAWLLTLAPVEHAGSPYAAYGDVHSVASLLWLWLAEGHAPDRWDLTGGAVLCWQPASFCSRRGAELRPTLAIADCRLTHFSGGFPVLHEEL
jgi:small multidrug resistance family-3 protein